MMLCLKLTKIDKVFKLIFNLFLLADLNNKKDKDLVILFVINSQNLHLNKNYPVKKFLTLLQ